MEIQKVVNEKGSDNINSSINQEFSEAELAFEAVHRSSPPFSNKIDFFFYMNPKTYRLISRNSTIFLSSVLHRRHSEARIICNHRRPPLRNSFPQTTKTAVE